MKKINLLIAITALIFASCSKDEVDGPSNTFETTAIMATIESGDNAASRGVNRPGTVLDWIDTIEITADHVGTIGPVYIVSETYEMVDDGTGASTFVLEDVALGENKFEARAESYEQDPAEEFLWVNGEADNPWQWVDDQRGRAPNVNFYDNDNPVQFIYEDPDIIAGENVVNFDMQAESGRLIVAVRMGDGIRTTFNSNFVYVSYKVTYADGTPGLSSGPVKFQDIHKDDLLTFYFSDNDKSTEGACVEFTFSICDRNSIVTNEFKREICIENGKSIGCVYEVEDDAVITDLNNFNFSFDWEEVDCDPCPSNQYITTVPRTTPIGQ